MDFVAEENCSAAGTTMTTEAVRPFNTEKRGKVPEWVVPAFFMLIGMAVRLSLTVSDPLLFPDSTEYLSLAGEIRSGAIFQPGYDLDQGFNQSRRRPLLYPLLVAVGLGTGAFPESAAIAVSLIFSALSFFPFYYAAREISSRRAATAATALYALHPYLAWYASPALSEPLFNSLYIIAFYVGTRALVQPGWKWFAAAGAVSALLVMTKEAGVAAPLLIGTGAVVQHILIDRVPVRRVAGWLAALALAFGVAAAPYLVEVRIWSGHWSLSAQMSSAGISRLALAGPGDAAAPDQYPLRITGPGPVRDQAPRLDRLIAAAAKTIANLGGYGLALIRGLGPAVFFLMLMGAGSFWRRDRFLAGAWPLLAMAAPWFLYSIVSPFMVDARYMLPLMPPALMLAGSGMARMGGLIAGPGGPWPVRRGRGIRMSMAIAGAGAYVFLARWGQFSEDREMLRTFAPGLAAGSWLLLYPAAAILLLAGAGPLGRRRIGPGFGLVRTAVLAGAAVLVGATLVPPYAAYRLQVGPESHYLLFSAGAREAGAEVRERGLVPAGRMIASVKPFLPYYFDGKWFIDPDRYYSLPGSAAEVDRLAGAGAFDYLTLDTYSVRVLKPALGAMALGFERPPGAVLIYSRYFKEYQRIVTVYDCRSPGAPEPGCLEAGTCLREARALFSAGRVVEASRRLDQALALDRDNLGAWDLQIKIYDIFYQCLRRADVPTRAMAPELLPGWTRAALEYRRLAPADPAINRLLIELQTIAASEQKMLDQTPR